MLVESYVHNRTNLINLCVFVFKNVCFHSDVQENEALKKTCYLTLGALLYEHSKIAKSPKLLHDIALVSLIVVHIMLESSAFFSSRLSKKKEGGPPDLMLMQHKCWIQEIIQFVISV